MDVNLYHIFYIVTVSTIIVLSLYSKKSFVKLNQIVPVSFKRNGTVNFLEISILVGIFVIFIETKKNDIALIICSLILIVLCEVRRRV